MPDERFDPRGAPSGRASVGQPQRAARAESLSDERLQRRVCERLTTAPDVDSSEIVVKVRNREATLEGEIPTPQMKDAAEACAAAVLGIERVHNLLQLPASRSDAEPLSPSPNQT